MKNLILLIGLFSTTAFSSTCNDILDLGFPIVGQCSVKADKIKNIDSEIIIAEASVCWGSYGADNDGENAVSVEMKAVGGEVIKYLWTMPTGRANRNSVNDYTYFGKWKKGIFYEDQTTIKDDNTFFKPFLRQGVVINYREKQVELVKTYKKFWGKQQKLIDAYLECGNLRPLL